MSLAVQPVAWRAVAGQASLSGVVQAWFRGMRATVARGAWWLASRIDSWPPVAADVCSDLW